MKRILLFLAVTAAIGMAVTGANAQADELNLYSYRQPFLIQPLMDAFTEETGTTVNVVYAKKGMLERIKAEGRNSPADLVLTVDIGRLNDMVEADVLAETSSEVLERKVPAHLRDPKGRWYGLTQRSRVIFVSRDRVPVNETFTYESLADPKYKGRICTRSGKHVYNVSLIASMVAHHGEAKTQEWLRGVKANLARKPQGNDRAQAKAIFEGQCDIGIGNTYYYGKMATNDKKPEQKEWAKSIRVVFPNQSDRGAHMNISGAGVLKSSTNKAAAIKLIEFLASPKAQEIYAQQNFEYPVVKGVPADPVTVTLGDFKPDTISLGEIAKYRTTASKLVDAVDFDRGPVS
ncbi:MAG: Fe(3+) ABC transporter substrate-binding protein [Gammaproteobacteria bacterium]|nr:Fe(3+) ABC transporter substrate-binding protein [Gammaproteobacteria bacterium]